MYRDKTCTERQPQRGVTGHLDNPALTSPAGHAIPPHPGPASTFSRTCLERQGTPIIVSSASTVVGGRVGAIPNNDGRATLESIDEEDGEGDTGRAGSSDVRTMLSNAGTLLKYLETVEFGSE